MRAIISASIIYGATKEILLDLVLKNGFIRKKIRREKIQAARTMYDNISGHERVRTTKAN